MKSEGDAVSPDGSGAITNTAGCCPITKQLFKDPVVLVDGISYERSAVAASNPPIMYSNRSLKSIVEDASRTALQRIQDKALQFITAEEDRPLSSGFYCPITLSLMHCPVIDPQGYTYEKVAIESWIQTNGDSPVTREALSVEELIPNLTVADLLLAEANKPMDGDGGDNNSMIHPAIRKWKTEAPPTAFGMIELTTSSDNTAAASIEEGAVGAVGGEDSLQQHFPTTREQYAAQLAERSRRKRLRMACRAMSLFLLTVLMAGSFFIPYLAAILLVLVLIGILVVTQDAASL